MQPFNLFSYLPALLLIGGFYYMTYRNSPQHATLLLVVVAVCTGISYITPREKFTLVGLALGIIGTFVVIIQSRNVREKSLQKWFVEKEFHYIKFGPVEALFTRPRIGTINYYPYKGEIVTDQQEIPCIIALRYSYSTSGKTPSIIADISYYFTEPTDLNLIERKFLNARENTPHTNLWKSHLRFFDLKDCEIFRPAQGGIVVSWRVPDSVEGYTDRYEWIINALQK
ncbi:hypothetical protein IC229_22815 [Spirosoma sp. BT702]|uniref:Uncharacterized protein n=1 Tax=Spirosoma profusum TaxID=2771354 RepID=A0A926Y051_9BACT|nr:hypothetical protein [Spirosoma profusum]MBD2703495.1 hypothetical protein [Spirosoma profusum]